MTNKVCKISLFTAILASISTLPVDAAVRTNNPGRSYADAYNQVNAMRYQQEYADANTVTTASATAKLPVMVSNEKLAAEILNNTSETTVGDLDACAMIYPNGVFRWETPESGIRRNPYDQCVAVVSLVDANTNAVLATTTVASGDSFKCNIDNFPESGMNAAALAKTELPADMAPTMEDVEAVMNEEQKQNAGFKIAAGAIIAGVAGNILAPKEAGNSKLLGTGKTQLVDTAIGAATGAGIMAASSYSGKVAGDTIKSTAVNAASGMLVGNMLAGATGGDSYLTIQKCNISEGPEGYNGEHDCISGTFAEQGKSISEIDSGATFLIDANKNIKKCKQDRDDSNNLNCEPYAGALVNITLATTGSKSSFDEIFTKGDIKDTEFSNLTRYYSEENNGVIFKSYVGGNKDNTYYKISNAYEAKDEKHAYIVFKNSLGHSIKGYKQSDFTKLIGGKEFEYFNRNHSGSVGAVIQLSEEKKPNVIFTPLARDASSGGLIDINNKARAKGTAVGAAAGGAMGGFAGYQGAQSEITDRWTAAVREYEDSLSNFVCMTGGRYLSKYNDYVEIPDWKKPE